MGRMRCMGWVGLAWFGWYRIGMGMGMGRWILDGRTTADETDNSLDVRNEKCCCLRSSPCLDLSDCLVRLSCLWLSLAGCVWWYVHYVHS